MRPEHRDGELPQHVAHRQGVALERFPREKMAPLPAELKRRIAPGIADRRSAHRELERGTTTASALALVRAFKRDEVRREFPIASIG